MTYTITKEKTVKKESQNFKKGDSVKTTTSCGTFHKVDTTKWSYDF